MGKTLVLIRHGHRDTLRRELDNGLDDKGREQARNIKRFFMNRFSSDDWKGGLWLVSSPKLRCMETITPTAKGLERTVDAHPDLIEQGPKETEASLSARVDHFLKEWLTSQAMITVACSHGDWLPIAAHRLLGLPVALKKGGWLEVEWPVGQRDLAAPGRGELKWYVPSFRSFYK